MFRRKSDRDFIEEVRSFALESSSKRVVPVNSNSFSITKNGLRLSGAGKNRRWRKIGSGPKVENSPYYDLALKQQIRQERLQNVALPVGLGAGLTVLAPRNNKAAQVGLGTAGAAYGAYAAHALRKRRPEAVKNRVHEVETLLENSRNLRIRHENTGVPKKYWDAENVEDIVVDRSGNIINKKTKKRIATKQGGLYYNINRRK